MRWIRRVAGRRMCRYMKRDQRQTDLRREAQELLVESTLVGHPVVLELEEEVARAEDVAKAQLRLLESFPGALLFGRFCGCGVEIGHD